MRYRSRKFCSLLKRCTRKTMRCRKCCVSRAIQAWTSSTSKATCKYTPITQNLVEEWIHFISLTRGASNNYMKFVKMGLLHQMCQKVIAAMQERCHPRMKEPAPPGLTHTISKQGYPTKVAEQAETKTILRYNCNNKSTYGDFLQPLQLIPTTSRYNGITECRLTIDLLSQN